MISFSFECFHLVVSNMQTGWKNHHRICKIAEEDNRQSMESQLVFHLRTDYERCEGEIYKFY